MKKIVLALVAVACVGSVHAAYAVEDLNLFNRLEHGAEGSDLFPNINSLPKNLPVPSIYPSTQDDDVQSSPLDASSPSNSSHQDFGNEDGDGEPTFIQKNPRLAAGLGFITIATLYKLVDYGSRAEFKQNEDALKRLGDIVARGDKVYDSVAVYKQFVEPNLSLLSDDHKVVIEMMLKEKQYEQLTAYIKNVCLVDLNEGVVSRNEKGETLTVGRRLKNGLRADLGAAWRAVDSWHWLRDKFSSKKVGESTAA